ncbi:tRNA lysidine(34) synthetase TilS [Mycoplasma phocoenae]|uniref:tRNA(Ile)-lysidine synthase n=1 Tax=Mycoplasma phocoenae TaxID=754517 RepID=A0A858U7J4_9MOLU|nr:tRNA lysidine(34) synthetase TilS [Mycoplasma phocoenae]QJG67225.1 tRNA lysidine(34) synthetase TilS [Mycoplasma phocoenae]
MNKYLLAVSGGPDSMFLLNKYKNENIVVACVNYNKRSTSFIDVNIVKDFCKKYDITLYLLEIDPNFEYKGNFQTIAREQRYDFFKNVYDKEKCTQLLVAHHKDDFIETAQMQENSKRKPNFYGIAQYSNYKDMNIYRPFLYDFWKDEIIDFLNKENIEFAIDESNDKPYYSRNKVRLNNKKITTTQKQKIFEKFLKTNQKLTFINEEINNTYRNWQSNGYDCDVLKNIDSTIKNRVVFKFLTEHFENLKLSSKKIENIVIFIESKNRTSKFLLKNNVYLIKTKNKLYITNKKNAIIYN